MKRTCAFTLVLLVLLTCILTTGCNQGPARLFEHSLGLDALSRAGEPLSWTWSNLTQACP